MTEEKLVVIIILDYNNLEDTLVSLDSISKLDYSPIEIVLVENGFSNSSDAVIRKSYPGVHLLESKSNLGAAGGRNLAINYANDNFNYDYFFFLDNDITIEKNTLSEMVKSINSKENIGIVSPKCYVMNKPGIIKYAGGMSINFFTGAIKDIGGGQKDSGQFEETKIVPACGGLCLVHKKVIDKIKVFDERFNPYGWEDVDFAVRAGKSGYKILYNPKGVIYHKGGKIGRGKSVAEYESSKVKNYFYLLMKHASFIQLCVLFFILPFKIVFIFIQEIFRGEFDTISSQIRGFFSLFKSGLK
ncbi:MAG: glycosyltransferase family 2 protein [Ignavibacteriaceae bacterium]